MFLCIFVFQNGNENEKVTIIQGKFKYNYHEIARGKWEDVWL